MDHPARFAYRRPDLGEEAGRGTVIGAVSPAVTHDLV